MKLLFTADLHIKLGQKNVPIPWAQERFSLFINQLSTMQDKADMLVLGGDIFDKSPTMGELELYIDLISSIKIPCIIYSGNHEAVKKNTTFLTCLKKGTNSLNKLVEIIDDFDSISGIDFIPYNKLKEKYPEALKNRILCTHVRGEILPHVRPEIDLSLLDKWDIVLAGDLHSASNSQRNILYPGSPYTTTFHRELVETSAILLDTDTLEFTREPFNLPQLIRTSIEPSAPIPKTEFHHTIYELVGDLHELASIEDNDLIGKKLVKRGTTVSKLLLDNNMDLQEEMREYLQYVLALQEDIIEDVVAEFINNKGLFEV